MTHLRFLFFAGPSSTGFSSFSAGSSSSGLSEFPSVMSVLTTLMLVDMLLLLGALELLVVVAAVVVEVAVVVAAVVAAVVVAVVIIAAGVVVVVEAVVVVGVEVVVVVGLAAVIVVVVVVEAVTIDEELLMIAAMSFVIAALSIADVFLIMDVCMAGSNFFVTGAAVGSLTVCGTPVAFVIEAVVVDVAISVFNTDFSGFWSSDFTELLFSLFSETFTGRLGFSFTTFVSM